MATFECDNPAIIDVCKKLCDIDDEKLTALCNLLCNEFEKIRICKLDENAPLDPEHGTIFDPEHGNIFDPEHGNIFDPIQTFYPNEGIPLGLISEGIYDSSGNRINPSKSKGVFLSLLSWIIKWENFDENPNPPLCPPFV